MRLRTLWQTKTPARLVRNAGCLLAAAVFLWAVAAMLSVSPGFVLLALLGAIGSTIVLRPASRTWPQRTRQRWGRARVRRSGRPRFREIALGVGSRTLAALIVVGLLPVLVAIGLAVKATSRGPVLVRQPRPRSDGGEYRALVFRTAPTRSERSSGNAGAGMTWIGQVLRRLSLVDLPRLFDVVRGDVPLLHAGHG